MRVAVLFYQLSPEFPVNEADIIGKPPKLPPEPALDKADNPADTAAGLEASEEPLKTVEPECAYIKVI